MQLPVPYRIKDQQLWLSPDRCVYWEQERALILSDLHFGKTGHFRKAGIAIPQTLYQQDLQRLLTLIQHFQPSQLLIVGDMFHSRENKELLLFKRWREDFPGIAVRLIKGNHDILHDDWYHAAAIETTPELLEIGPFSFMHDITACTETTGYCFSGHIHPGIIINGPGKQHLRLPCFYFGENYAVLPAFSRFTGTASIDPTPGSNVFAILPSNPLKGEYGSIVQMQ